MTKVYVLHHVRADDENSEDAKLIGVYRTKEAAEGAIARVKGQPGFGDHADGNHIDAYELDKDHWVEGFATILRPIEDPNQA